MLKKHLAQELTLMNSVSGAESDVVDWRNGIEEYFQ